ncbi:hypothetical protein DASC09_055220 [Saccharomycopsis crataegensis]|uniref:Uncharacterized protein n=1 Tax=Saccharomycopsis crataegensis TaxID=43959 RepID=A0AAV5QTL5_9ASCO|nr:hypothetical protein DASC09_055220 [Saccharomycopsis crataegensis]
MMPDNTPLHILITDKPRESKGFSDIIKWSTREFLESSSELEHKWDEYTEYYLSKLAEDDNVKFSQSLLTFSSRMQFSLFENLLKQSYPANGHHKWESGWARKEREGMKQIFEEMLSTESDRILGKMEGLVKTRLEDQEMKTNIKV